MSKLRKHDHTMDGSDWDLSALSLNDCPVDELTRNPKAKRIDFSQNFFTKLPASFTSLSHLTELDLSKNRLTELPQDFGRLNKLVRLDLYDNRLKTLPLSFGQLFRLKWLDLKGNPLEPNLAKYAGDCANQKQCQTCALNCLRFMKYEKIRVESEMRQKEEKLKQQIEFEDRMDVKNKKEREKKKLKNARRSARKAQQKTDDNEENDDNDTKGSDSDSKTTGSGSPRSTSFGRKVFNFVMFLIRLLLFLSSISLILFIGISIALHLQNGRKLESIEDIKTALSNSYKLAQNHQQFLKDTTLLIENIVKGLKNWRTTFKVFDEKPNVINK